MAGVDIITYALSKKYTDETAMQFGGLKGAPCKVKSVEKRNGVNIVTFEWKNDAGEVRESQLVVNDGTPIYVWESGNLYKYGDLVIYASCFYRCIAENSDTVFDDRKWNEIGSPDGNYDIVENSTMLPPIFTSADRKMYYAIEEGIFYLWDGYYWVPQNNLVQYPKMPTPKRVLLGRVTQYIGETNLSFTSGHFYKCIFDEDSQSYKWDEMEVNDTVDGLSEEEMAELLQILKP